MVNIVDGIKDEDLVPIEPNEEFENHIINVDYGKILSLMVHKFLYDMPRKEEHPQRCSIFCT